MKNLNDLLELSRSYSEAHERKNERLRIWTDDRYTIVKEMLEEISTSMTREIPFFQSNLYVNCDDDNRYNGVSISSGLVRLGNGIEEGFHIQFSPLPNGRIAVLAFEHTLRDSPNKSTEIEIVEPEELTTDKIVDLVYQGIEAVRKTSLLFIGEE